MKEEKRMKLKVCGMRRSDNIKGLVDLAPDFIGFIFYPKSPRYANELDPEALKAIPSSMLKTGVFVNAELSEIVSLVKKYQLDAVQLHGDESVEMVQELKQRGLTVIKVFRIKDELPEALAVFEGHVDYFLFDTKSKDYGGTGQHFDWSVLLGYVYETPYLLSGGVELSDLEAIQSLSLPRLVGLDVNSKFELEPGFKDLALVKKLKEQL